MGTDYDTLQDCALCAERKYGRGPVPGTGNPKLAKICFLGRNPGPDEDRGREPFIGRAGRKLNQGCLLSGIVRNTCYVTNVVKCMTPPNIKPSRTCTKLCSQTWLDREMAALESLQLVVALGNVALHYFEPLTRVGMLHGYDFEADKPWADGGKIRIFVCYHPSAALRYSAINRAFQGDIRKLGKLIETLKQEE